MERKKNKHSELSLWIKLGSYGVIIFVTAFLSWVLYAKSVLYYRICLLCVCSNSGG